MNTRRKQQIERSAKDPLTIEKVRTEKHIRYLLCQLIINIERRKAINKFSPKPADNLAVTLLPSFVCIVRVKNKVKANADKHSGN